MIIVERFAGARPARSPPPIRIRIDTSCQRCQCQCASAPVVIATIKDQQALCHADKSPAEGIEIEVSTLVEAV